MFSYSVKGHLRPQLAYLASLGVDDAAAAVLSRPLLLGEVRGRGHCFRWCSLPFPSPPEITSLTVVWHVGLFLLCLGRALVLARTLLGCLLPLLVQVPLRWSCL